MAKYLQRFNPDDAMVCFCSTREEDALKLLQLNYSEESNIAPDFRKELGYCPNEVRKRLTEQSPEKLLR